MRGRMMAINVYILEDKVWLVVNVDGIDQLHVAEHKGNSTIVTKSMAERGEVPQEVVEWYKGE